MILVLLFTHDGKIRVGETDSVKLAQQLERHYCDSALNQRLTRGADLNLTHFHRNT